MEDDYLWSAYGHDRIPCPECARKGGNVVELIPPGEELISIHKVVVALAGTGLAAFVAGLFTGLLCRRRKR
jgi:hypothetical protein